MSYSATRKKLLRGAVWTWLLRYRVALATGFVALFYLAALTPLVQGADDATYIALAKALASGQGYRQVWRPEAPPETHFSIGFPLLLAPVLMVLPDFPINVNALILVSVVFGVLTVPLLHCLLTEESDLSQSEILVVVLLAALNPLMLRFTSQTVMSEVTYTWFSLAALRLAGRYRAAQGWRSRSLLLMAPTLAMSYLLRVVGIILIAAVALDLLWRRQGRKLLVLLALVGLLVAPWLYRNAQVGAGAATLSYASDFWLKDYARPGWGRIQSPLELGVRVVSNAWEHVTRQWPYIFLPNLGGNAVSGFIGRFGLGWLVTAIGLGLVALVLLGMAHQWRKGGRLLPLYLTLYVGLILLPPWVTSRNWVPVLPLLFCFLASGLKAIARWILEKPGIPAVSLEMLTVGLMVLILAGMLISDRHYVRVGLAYRLRGQLPPSSESLQETWQWIDHSTPQDGVFVYQFPAKLYLNTGRTTIGLASTVEIATAVRGWQAAGASFLVTQPQRPFGGQYDTGEPLWLRGLNTLAEPAFVSHTAPQTFVYALDDIRRAIPSAGQGESTWDRP